MTKQITEAQLREALRDSLTQLNQQVKFHDSTQQVQLNKTCLLFISILLKELGISHG